MFPFSGRSWRRKQKIFGITLILIGLVIALISAPFVVQFGSWTIASSILGGLFFIIGLLYFLEVTIE